MYSFIQFLNEATKKLSPKQHEFMMWVVTPNTKVGSFRRASIKNKEFNGKIRVLMLDRLAEAGYITYK